MKKYILSYYVLFMEKNIQIYGKFPKIIAKKIDLVSAVKKANDYVYRCVSSNIKAGKGSLVLKHW